MILRAAPLSLLLLFVAAPAHADERRYMLSSFDRIRVEGPFEVTVVAGSSAGAVATGERRSLDSVSVRVQGTTLIVSPSVNAWGGYPGAASSTPRVTVTAGALRAAAMIGGGRLSVARMGGARIELTLTGAGALTVGDARGDRVDATLIGTGRIVAAGQVLKGRFESSGAGAVDAAGLSVGELTVNWRSDGDGRFAARATADVDAAARGAVTVLGTAACTVRGGGPVTCGTR